MDLFAWSNEAEASARAAIVPWTDGVAAVEYRYARLAQPGGGVALGVPDDDRKRAGQHRREPRPRDRRDGEVVAVGALALEAGYSIFFLGDGARAILAADGIGKGSPTAPSPRRPPRSSRTCRRPCASPERRASTLDARAMSRYRPQASVRGECESERTLGLRISSDSRLTEARSL